MKNTFFLIFIFSFSFALGQGKQFLYDYTSIPDSTKKDIQVREIMVLNIEKDKSEFYSLEKYKADSTLLGDSNKGVFSMPPNKKMNGDRIIKYYNSPNIRYVTLLNDTQYNVDQNVNLKWSLLNEYNTLLGYKVQKAFTEYGGRKWIAWFSQEIPFSDGPYKFSNLPGLIIKIEDTGGNHVYELKGIHNSENKFEYPKLNNFKEVSLKFQKFVKVYKSYRKNPLGLSADSYPDQTDSNGVFHSGVELFRQNQRRAIKEMEKDNNIIEIFLLK